MLKHTNLKSLDLTEIQDKSHIRKNHSIQRSITSILNRNLPIGSDDSIFNDSLLNQSKLNKLNESNNGKYAKLLDPSFLKEDDQTLTQKNNSTYEFENNDNVPPHLLRLLPKNNVRFDEKINDRTIKDIIRNAKNNKSDLITSRINETSRLEDQLSNKYLLNKSNVLNSKLIELKSYNLKSVLNSKDISYIHESSHLNRNNELPHLNESSIIKEYYKDETGEYSLQVDKKNIKSNIYMQIFQHDHSEKLLDQDFQKIKSKMYYGEKLENLEKGTNITKIIDLSNILNKESVANIGSKNFLSNRSIRGKSSILNQSIISSKIPTARKDVKILEEWLDFSLSQLKDNTSRKEILTNSQLIYSACFKELIRQVSLHCVERANLIQRIWNEYLSLVERAILTEKCEINSLETLQINELSRVHKLYENEFKLMTENYNVAVNDIIVSQTERDKKIKENNYLLKLCSIHDKKYKELQLSNQDLRIQIDKLLLENYNLKLESQEKHETPNLKTTTESSMAKKLEDENELISETKKFFIAPRNKEEYIGYNMRAANKKSVVQHLIGLKNGNHDKKNKHKDGREQEEKVDNNKKEVPEEDVNNKEENSNVLGSQKEIIVEEHDQFDFLTELQEKTKDINIDNISDFSLLKDQGIDPIDCYKEDKCVETNFFEEEKEILEYEQNRNSNKDFFSEIRDIVNGIDPNHDLFEKTRKALIKVQLALKNRLSSHSKDLYIENQTSRLKEIIYKMKIEQSELGLENEDLREKLKNEESLIYTFSKNSDLIKKENKLLKKNTKDIQRFLQILTSIAEKGINGNEVITELDDFKKNAKLLIEKSQDIMRGSLTREITFQLKNKEIKEEEEKSESSEEDNEVGLSQISSTTPIRSLRNSIAPFDDSAKSKKIVPSAKDLNFKSTIKRVFSVNTDNANVLLNQILSHIEADQAIEKKESPNLIRLNLLLKFISKIYREKYSQNQNLIHVPLHVECYEFLLNRYGLKREAEKKLKEIFSSCLVFQNKNHRISTFTLLVGLIGEKDSDDFIYFMNAMKFFDEKDGIKIHESFQEKVFVPYYSTLQLISILFENRIDLSYYKNLLLYVEEFKIKRNEEEIVIEFDLIMLKIMDIYEIQKTEMKAHLQYLFFAADLDQDQYIELYEFLLIYRHIEKKKFTQEKVKRIFVEESDTIVPITGERAISFSKFINLAIEYNLFSEAKTKIFQESVSPEVNSNIAKFLNSFYLNKDKIKNMDDLTVNCDFKMEELKLRFIKAKCFNALFKKIMMHLEEKIKDIANYNAKILWLSYKLLEEESKRVVLDHTLNDLLPMEFKIITETYSELDEIEIEFV